MAWKKKWGIGAKEKIKRKRGQTQEETANPGIGPKGANDLGGLRSGLVWEKFADQNWSDEGQTQGHAGLAKQKAEKGQAEGQKASVTAKVEQRLGAHQQKEFDKGQRSEDQEEGTTTTFDEEGRAQGEGGGQGEQHLTNWKGINE